MYTPKVVDPMAENKLWGTNTALRALENVQLIGTIICFLHNKGGVCTFLNITFPVLFC